MSGDITAPMPNSRRSLERTLTSTRGSRTRKHKGGRGNKKKQLGLHGQDGLRCHDALSSHSLRPDIPSPSVQHLHTTTTNDNNVAHSSSQKQHKLLSTVETDGAIRTSPSARLQQEHTGENSSSSPSTMGLATAPATPITDTFRDHLPALAVSPSSQSITLLVGDEHDKKETLVERTTIRVESGVKHNSSTGTSSLSSSEQKSSMLQKKHLLHSLPSPNISTLVPSDDEGKTQEQSSNTRTIQKYRPALVHTSEKVDDIRSSSQQQESLQVDWTKKRQKHPSTVDEEWNDERSAKVSLAPSDSIGGGIHEEPMPEKTIEPCIAALSREGPTCSSVQPELNRKGSHVPETRVLSEMHHELGERTFAFPAVHSIHTEADDEDEEMGTIERALQSPMILTRDENKERVQLKLPFPDGSEVEDELASYRYAHSGIIERALSKRTLSLFLSLFLLLPLFLVILVGGSKICPLIGRTKYRLFLAILPMSATLGGNTALESNFTSRTDLYNLKYSKSAFVGYFVNEVGKAVPLAIITGIVMAMFAYVSSGMNAIFSLAIGVAQIFTILSAATVGISAPALLISILGYRNAEMFGESLVTIVQDTVGGFIMIHLSHLLFMMFPIVVSHSDTCSA